MSKLKHTPGPWKTVRREVLEDGSVYPAHIVGGPEDHQVCTLEAPVIAELAVKEPEWGWGIRDANARLLTAAPDLLEALQSLDSLRGAFAPSDSEIKAAWDKATAAIAKATGAQ